MLRDGVVIATFLGALFLYITNHFAEVLFNVNVPISCATDLACFCVITEKT